MTTHDELPTSDHPTPDADGTDERLDHRRKWQAFAVAVGVAALTILDLSKVNVGLPSIETSLGAGSTALQLIVAGYSLAFGLALVPSGRLGDMTSRRRMFVIGLAAFTLASLGCALAPDITTLVVFRMLQGIAAGIQMPQVVGLLQQLFRGSERGRAFGLFGAMIGVSTAFGPTLGGLLIGIGGEQDGWRLLFWMNIPLGVIAMIAALRLLPGRGARPSVRMTLDPVGIVLLGVATLALMLPFVLSGQGGTPPWVWAALPVCAVAVFAFIRWERRYAASGRTPVLDAALLRRSSYRNGLLVATAWFAALPGSFLIATLYLQQGLGLEPVYAGMVTISSAIASAVSSYLGGRVVERFGRSLVVVGIAVALVGAVLTVLAAVLPAPEATPWLMAAALLVFGAGAGLVISPNQTLTLSEVPIEQGGVAGSLTQVAQRVGTAIGLAAATAVFYATISAEGGGSDIAVYHDAYAHGYAVCGGFMLAALAVGLLDLVGRRRRSARA